MNAGLSNLATLKAWLLPEALRTGTDYDSQILAIGLGVAVEVQEYCNRLFARGVDTTYETNANRTSLVVQQYPIEAISKIEIRDDLSAGWVDQGTVNDVLFNRIDGAGMLIFAGYLGAIFSRIRITYTGGYFYETLEPEDLAYPTTLPAEATALPDDLKLAWLTQCEFVWSQRDKLGLNIAEKPVTDAPLKAGQLLPAVAEVLRRYVRYT